MASGETAPALNSDMDGMHEQVVDDGHDMATMHEQMMDASPEMSAMHQQMMEDHGGGSMGGDEMPSMDGEQPG